MRATLTRIRLLTSSLARRSLGVGGFILSALLLSAVTAHAQFTANNQTITITTPVNWPGDYVVGSNTFGDVLQVQSGGVLTNDNGYVGYETSNNSALVTGSGIWTNNEWLYVGYLGAGNTLTISNGGTVFSLDASIGHTTSTSNNNVLVTDSGIWNNHAYLYVGSYGSSNTLTIANGGTVVDYSGDVGYSSSSNVVTVTGTSSVWSNQVYLTIGGNEFAYGFGGTGNQLIVTNGGKVFSAYGHVGSYLSPSNSVTVTGPGSIWNNSSDLFVGVQSAGNTLTIADGGTVVDHNGYVGNSAGNAVTVTGTGSVWSNNYWLFVGYDGAGNTLTITNGGTVLSSFGWLGYDSSSSNNVATVTGTGSVWSNQYFMIVGEFGSSNSLTIANGGKVFNDNGYVGTISNNNAVTVTGSGSVWNNSLDLYVGYQGAGNTLTIANGGTVFASNLVVGSQSSALNNLVTVSGGNVIVTNAPGNGALVVGQAGQGTFTQNGGTVIADQLFVTNGNSSAFNLNSGTLTVNNGATVANGQSFMVGDNGGAATFNILGGTSRFNDGLTVANSAGSVGVVTMSSGQLAVTNAGHTASLVVGRAGNGTFTQNGGTVTVDQLFVTNGNSSTFNLNSGTLTVKNGATVYNQNFAVGSSGKSATLNLLGGNNHIGDALYIGPSSSSTGTVNLSGGTLNLPVYAAYGSLIVGSDGAGTFNLSGAGVVNSTGHVTVGLGLNAPGSGTINHTGGSLTVGTPSAAATLYLGYTPGAAGTYHMDNSTGVSTLNVYGALAVGYHGNGTLTQDAGTVTINEAPAGNGNTGFMEIGAAPGTTGSYTINGGTLTANGPFGIQVGGAPGNPGGTGTLTVNGGTVNAILQVWGAGTFTLNGGTLNSVSVENDGVFNANGGAFNLAGVIKGTGIIHTHSGTSVSLAGGTAINSGFVDFQDSTVTAAGALSIAPVSGSSASLNVGTGSELNAPNSVITVGSAGVGSMTSSGNIQAQQISLGGSSAGASGTLHQLGGTTRLTGAVSSHNPILNALGITSNDAELDGGTLDASGAQIVAGLGHNGQINVNGSTVLADQMLVGFDSGVTGTFTMASGSVNVAGTLGVGNYASITNGAGTGHVSISGGTLTAATVILGSTTGAQGDMTVSGTGHVTVTGGMSWNDLTVNGGVVEVIAGPPPPGEDPVLNNAMVGGYLRDGAMTVNGGTVSAPIVKIGVTPGQTGTLTMNGGVLSTDNLLATNGAGSVIHFNGGVINTKSTTVNTGSSLIVGDGTYQAVLNLEGGTHSFANDLTIAVNGLLSGTGTIHGDVTVAGTLAPGNSPGSQTINGNLTLSNSAVFAVQLGGTTQGTEYDFVHVLTNATLAGTLDLSFVNGFQFAITNSDTFKVLTADGAFSGAFANIASGQRLLTADDLGWFVVTYDDNHNLVLSDFIAVPEPSVLLLLALGGVVLRRLARGSRPARGARS